MSLSANTVHTTREASGGPANIMAGPGLNANVFWAGAFVMRDISTGLFNEAADTANFFGFGIVRVKVTADGAAGDNEVQVLTGPLYLVQRAVVGVTAITNVGDLVYATADDTLAVAATSNTKAVGEVTRWCSGTTCDVLIYGWDAQRAL